VVRIEVSDFNFGTLVKHVWFTLHELQRLFGYIHMYMYVICIYDKIYR
jgi:hypothetical protein